MAQRIIGIMGALPEEINGVVNLLQNKKEHRFGKRIYYTGTINNQDVVVVYSRIGKVAAAATVSTLILKFNITELIFTGVAGGIASDLKIGDIVLGTELVQHDMDATPLFPQFEIPLIGKSHFKTDSEFLKLGENSIQHILENSYLHQVIDTEDLDQFNIHHPKLHLGLIASGDQFFKDSEQKNNLLSNLPDTKCVEMEGAAVAQVCYEFGIPFIVIRTISDEADQHSTIDFMKFTEKISNIYSIEIIKNIIK
ncbi:5'-methylthioadenosine/adenosylhomocysteine nucleosidase [Faecalibacter macacae]|uniref:adenosylhomocysteine nucleosidase n=1 Tax=Faecalibacter macacae TaxID=1859289 RepID=A0A3L9MNM0_9FLAO|nr:5'-methylthioadenosine/adenosylhomocysteine nucleosidase [Faecalibacter macacae]RLZ12269.1 5'-methylthioadenosine/adenosylhomocysteine nucleosidase [Faecalibacter macacae]